MTCSLFLVHFPNFHEHGVQKDARRRPIERKAPSNSTQRYWLSAEEGGAFIQMFSSKLAENKAETKESEYLLTERSTNNERMLQLLHKVSAAHTNKQLFVIAFAHQLKR